jgi:hypothetical protein
VRSKFVPSGCAAVPQPTSRLFRRCVLVLGEARVDGLRGAEIRRAAGLLGGMVIAPQSESDSEGLRV